MPNDNPPVECSECGHLHFQYHAGAIRAPFGHYVECPLHSEAEPCPCPFAAGEPDPRENTNQGETA